ncbi:hypothetical protein [Rubellicoccus peritrichatus]|uniref:PEP-CTERM protein-sorting domain-containing protein n=1 Tax=Rubellicoccus peritrichatus TaxID=3080537 RepID=A0AAQ3QX35_9BACT|nr:hypothetical protein [Puniceicoccus sp. CR14]WOO42480.1 hypothetical protein RZN69_05215 [Puniceicoccus sp. CR14]
MRLLLYPFVLLFMAVTSSLHGLITITVMQQASDVVITASGTANINDLGVPLNADYHSHVHTNINQVFVGPATGMHSGKAYLGLSSSEPFGTGNFRLADSGSGDAFGIANTQLVVPDGYNTGDNLSGSGTYEGTTIALLGITEQTWTWGSGPNADSATLTIVPEPSIWATLLGLMALGFVAWRRGSKS